MCIVSSMHYTAVTAVSSVTAMTIIVTAGTAVTETLLFSLVPSPSFLLRREVRGNKK